MNPRMLFEQELPQNTVELLFPSFGQSQLQFLHHAFRLAVRRGMLWRTVNMNDTIVTIKRIDFF